MDDMHFVAPARKGWVINLKASVNYVGTTSMEVGVRVDAENPQSGETFHTATAYLTFVALDSNGRPSSVPPIRVESEDEKRRYKAAAERVLARKESRKRLKKK